MTETQIQIQIADWLRRDHPNWLWLHIPNEGLRDPRAGAILRKMGMARGWPDIMIFEHRTFISGIAMEIKSTNGRATQAQMEILYALRRRGWIAAIVRSLDDAKRLCE